jgi:hypothetical protein
MPKTFPTALVFLTLSLFCGLLYAFRSPEEGLLFGLLYGAVLALKLPKTSVVRELFPLVMLFLFLIVLSQAPTRLFTFSLIYTARALILFRGMIMLLLQLQNKHAAFERKDWSGVLGFAAEFALTVVFAYSTFQPVGIDTLNFAHIALGGTIMVLSSLFTPYWIPGVLFGALSFYPTTKLWGIIGFGLLAVYESYFLQRARSAPSTIL